MIETEDDEWEINEEYIDTDGDRAPSSTRSTAAAEGSLTVSPSDTTVMSFTFRDQTTVSLSWNELTGAIGDSATVLPVVVAVAVLTELSLSVTLVWFAVFQVVWGVVLRSPRLRRTDEGVRRAGHRGTIRLANSSLQDCCGRDPARASNHTVARSGQSVRR